MRFRPADIIKLILSILVSGLLIYFLLSKIDTAKFAGILVSSDKLLLLLGLALYFSMLLFRSLRFKILLGHKISLRSLIPIVFVYNALNYVLPFKLGELSFGVLIKKTHLKSFGLGFTAVLVSRIFEVFLLLVLLFIGMLLNLNTGFGSKISILIPFVAVFMLGLTAGFLALVFFPAILVKIADFVFNQVPIKNPLLKKLSKKINEFILIFEKYRSKRLLLDTFYVSLAASACGFLTTFFMVRSFGYNIPLNILLVAITFSVLSGLIPVNGIAGFGTYESFWVLAFLYFGYTMESAVIISLGIHIIQLVFAVFLGSIGWVAISRENSK